MTRYRLFRQGEYVRTAYTEQEEQRVLDNLFPTAELGDVVYINDVFFLRGKTMWGLLGAEDPLVKGLYTKAVRAEIAAGAQ